MKKEYIHPEIIRITLPSDLSQIAFYVNIQMF